MTIYVADGAYVRVWVCACACGWGVLAGLRSWPPLTNQTFPIHTQVFWVTRPSCIWHLWSVHSRLWCLDQCHITLPHALRLTSPLHHSLYVLPIASVCSAWLGCPIMFAVSFLAACPYERISNHQPCTRRCAWSRIIAAEWHAAEPLLILQVLSGAERGHCPGIHINHFVLRALSWVYDKKRSTLDLRYGVAMRWVYC